MSIVIIGTAYPLPEHREEIISTLEDIIPRVVIPPRGPARSEPGSRQSGESHAGPRRHPKGAE